jgi:hypothetical protein
MSEKYSRPIDLIDTASHLLRRCGSTPCCTRNAFLETAFRDRIESSALSERGSITEQPFLTLSPHRGRRFTVHRSIRSADQKQLIYQAHATFSGILD